MSPILILAMWVLPKFRRREKRAAERAAAGDAICVAGNVPAEDANPNSAAEEAVN